MSRVNKYTSLIKYFSELKEDGVNGEEECSYCSGMIAIPGKTSFKALYSELVKEFSPINKYKIFMVDYIIKNSN